MVVDADCLCEPHFTLESFVEHALIRSKDVVAVSTVVPGAYLQEHVQVPAAPYQSILNTCNAAQIARLQATRLSCLANCLGKHTMRGAGRAIDAEN